MITHADLPDELNLATLVRRPQRRGGPRRPHRADQRGRQRRRTPSSPRLVNRCGQPAPRARRARAGPRAARPRRLASSSSPLWYGAQKIGAVTAEAYTFLQPKDYAYYLEYTDAAVVVADETTEPAIRRGRRRAAVLVVDESVRGERLERAAPTSSSPLPTTKDDVALWKFTTGSTGQPKGAVHPVHSPVLSHDWYAQGVLGIREDDVVLPVPKLFFGYARDLTALYPFGVGAAGIVFPERTTPERIFELIAEHRPTILVNVPTMMAQMVDHPRCGQRRTCPACACARPPARRCRASCTTAGSTRSASRCSTGSARPSCTTSTSRTGPAARAPGAPASSCRATRPSSTRTASCSSPGDTAALLYWGDDEKTKRTFDGDTVRTGDLFERDDDGFFWYRGRVDDLIKVGGIWVAPAEIEHCLVGAPGRGRVRGRRRRSRTG